MNGIDEFIAYCTVIARLCQQHPIEMLLLLVVAMIGIAVAYYRGYGWGVHDGSLEQHQKDMDALCHEGEHEYEHVDSHGLPWKVIVTGIMQRRGRKNPPGVTQLGRGM